MKEIKVTAEKPVFTTTMDGQQSVVMGIPALRDVIEAKLGKLTETSRQRMRAILEEGPEHLEEKFRGGAVSVYNQRETQRVDIRLAKSIVE